ncbi:peroxidase-like isoform X1 [Bombus bifarius]|uniref:Peroxidase-like isoform X1 n=2 Tax=Bombus bifarius TaxID=103933 RepID=A0A6P8NEJ5_9HYME|nr:peroxidase-like isoform X1 [Bombus vancouverensis nearcticus]XP_033319603.1 peroxidase-like isoform X1 [Bombus bifarius]
MFLVVPADNNRWAYTMHGLEKPMDHVSAGGLMAGSVATLAILWVSLQTMGFLGNSHAIGAYKLPMSVQNYLASYTGILSGLPMSNDPYEGGVVDTGRFHNRRYPHIDEAVLNNSITFAQSLIDRMSTLERNIANAGVELMAHTPAGKQFLDSYPSEDAFERGLDAIVAMKASSYLLHQNCRRFGLEKDDCARYISTLSLQGTSLDSACPTLRHPICDLTAKYRSIDGACNNVENPSWGSAMTAYTRILFPQYFDGIQEPRRMGQTRKPLPGARSVSVALSTPNDQSDVSRTLTVVQWTQFITNDISYTPMRKMVSSGKPISCCRSDGNALSPRYMHPDCSAIIVPDRDPVYGQHYVRCMNYVRSLPVLKSDCTFGPIEQMNQASHFLDGSTIYGSTLKKSRELREFEGGRLRVHRGNDHDFLPIAENSSECKNGCYDSGDNRVNTHPQLAAIHTIWHREHNRIARKLAELNPHWSDETLYQEARRIVIAEIQHITYKEWLPILLGKRYTRAIGLAVGNSYSRNYNSEDEPAVSNEVATAALRFMNSLLQGKISLTDNKRQINKTVSLAEYFYKPNIIESHEIFDGLLRGMATQSSQKMDISIIEDVTSKLFATNQDSLGLDAISLDIQRGRDHGLPGYNHYRKYCGLPAAKSFDDFLDYIPMEMTKKLRTIYAHPDDVDLIIGGMAERPTEDGLLGVTFRCLISEQFSRTRRTDRYFYDSANQPQPFTVEQLAEIRNVTLARIFCDNGNNITEMQPNVFLRPQAGNELRSCTMFEAIPSVDLFAWAERAKAYR